MDSERKEILSAEVFLNSFGRKVDTADIDAELERVNQELQAYRCDAGTMTASVLAGGDISGCMSIRAHYAQGNIYRDKFSQVWKNRFEPMRDRRWMKRDHCARCKAWDWCVGGPFHLRGDQGEMLHCNYRTLCEP